MIAIYCRQSVDKKDSISIGQQEAACKRLTGTEENCLVFSDKGFTGANTHRPGFEKMMREIKKGRIAKVIVYKVDRISRSLLDFVGIYSLFEKYQVEFVSCSEQFDTSTAMGKATLQIIMVFAELERNMIQKRVKDNFYDRAKKGLYLAGVAPFGYCKVPITVDGIHTHCLAPDQEHPEKLSSVRWMYESCLLHKSLGQIARELNVQGMMTNRSKPFTSVSVSRILRNTVYVRADADVYHYLKEKGAVIQQPVEDFTGVYGCTVYGTRKQKTTQKFTDLHGENVQLNHHEGLISSADWLAVQHELDQHKPVSNSGKGRNTWLTGLTKCRFCGRGVTVVNGQRNGKRYLNCGGRKEHLCPGRSHPMTFDEIEEAVKNDLLQTLRSFAFTPAVHPRVVTAEENHLKIRLIRNREEIEKLMEKLADAGKTLMTYIRERIQQLDAENKEISAELNRQSDEQPTEDVGQLRKRLMDWDELAFDEKKRIAQAFLSSVIVGDGEIEVVYQ